MPLGTWRRDSQDLVVYEPKDGLIRYDSFWSFNEGQTEEITPGEAEILARLLLRAVEKARLAEMVKRGYETIRQEVSKREAEGWVLVHVSTDGIHMRKDGVVKLFTTDDSALNTTGG